MMDGEIETFAPELANFVLAAGIASHEARGQYCCA
jgi:hypothetical protein